jgi:eukaryotic-like serine/threonine-protein kinase
VAGQRVDGRSDQFSLAVMLYELLSGEKAFPGDSLTTVLYRIMQEEPIPLRRVNPAMSDSVDAVLRKAMSKNPANRYPRAADFGRDLMIVASGGTVAVSTPPPPMVWTPARSLASRPRCACRPLQGTGPRPWMPPLQLLRRGRGRGRCRGT